MSWRKILAIALGALALGIALLWLNAWSVLGWMQESRDADAVLEIRHLRGSVHLIEATRDGERPYGYVASLASLGPDGAFLVDPMVSAALGSKLDELLAERGSPVRYLANTHAHPDHTRGNVAFDDEVRRIAHEAAALEMSRSLKPFPILPATEPMPERGRPNVTFTDRHVVDMNGERVVLRHFGPAHTAGDAFVFFEEAAVIHAGDAFLGGGGRAVAAPISGGSFEGLDRALGALIEAAPADAIVVGGHGALGEVWTIADVEHYRRVLQAALAWVTEAESAGPISDEDFAAARLREWETWSPGSSPAPLLEAISAARSR